MDILEAVKNDKAYKKYKILVKKWEKEFKMKHSRIPSKFDIKEAPTKVRYAYKKYFEIKSTALENSLDICDFDERFISSPDSSFIVDGLMELQSPKSDNLIERLPNGLELNQLLSNEQVIERDIITYVSKTAVTEKIKTDGPKAIIPLNADLSKKLFQNSKFTLRNPRKSLNKSQTFTESNLDIHNIEQRLDTGDSQNFTDITNTWPVTNTADIQFTINKSKSQDTHSLRQINDGWLERVTGITMKENNKPSLQEKFGMKNINIITDKQYHNENKCEDNICDYVENSESDEDSSNKFKPALKKRRVGYNIEESVAVNNSKGEDIQEVTKLETNVHMRKKSKGIKDINEDVPPRVDEFVPFGVEEDLLPRHTANSNAFNKTSSVNTEPLVSKSKSTLTASEKLEQKIKSGTLNDNFVKINIEKKVFVRGKKSFNYTKHKKQQWKIKKANAGMEFPISGKIECFKCGEIGHMSRYCTAHRGDSLLPLHAYENESIPTLEEMNNKCNNTKDVQTLYETETYTAAVTFKPSPIPESFLNMLSKSDKSIVKPLYSNFDSVDMNEVCKTLHLFGHESFRPGQEQAIKRILCGYSTLLLLSTGGGKSLCYQLPAYIYSKNYKCITLVISPLVSLMEDQVLSMPDFLKAGCLHTNQPPTQRSKIIQLLKDGELNILLISPEALISGDASNGFGGLFKSLPPIAFVCIDEAHCVSQWSHNFRPSYLMISRVLREKLKVKTILGLTATASQATIQSVISHINIPDGLTGVISNPDLPNNLLLSVSQEKDKDRALINLLSSEPISSYKSIIVYCIRRDECVRIAAVLRSSLQEPGKPVLEKRGKKRKQMSFVAETYHAGMSAAQRKKIQNHFMDGSLRIIVATVAFGMGINKADIRCIIHYDMPSSFESYVQEVGRAGRDGQQAHCHVFVNSNKKDKDELLKHIYSNSIDRHVIRKLLQKVFLPCECNKNMTGIGTNSRCNGHEVAIPIDDTVEELDLAAENIATLLCYLELHPGQRVKVLHNTYTVCKIFSYGGTEKLKESAANCPPLAMAYQLKNRKPNIGNSLRENGNIFEFPVVEVAAELGWESGITKFKLKNLEWKMDNGAYKRSQFKVEFHTLGFRIRAHGDLTSVELDEMLDHLHEKVISQEKSKLCQLEEFNLTLSKIGKNPVLSINWLTEMDSLTQKSNELKRIIRNYFQRESSTSVTIALEERPLDEQRILDDVRGLINSYKDCSFTGRSIARILQGIPSPNYPALVWGRCKFWRTHMHEDFYGLIRIATQQIINMKLNKCNNF